MKKRLVIWGTILILFIIIFVVILSHMYIHAKSEDGDWDVYYIINIEDPKLTWNGYVFYHGTENFDTIQVKNQFSQNGEFASFSKEKLELNFLEKMMTITQKGAEGYGICTLCSIKPYGSIEIQWISNNNENNVFLHLTE